MKRITKFKRSVKAISPIISVLLMIAIAVSAALVAYAWVSGYMDFTTTKVGKSIQIQSISTNAVYVQNVGDSPVTISDVYVDAVLNTDNDLPVDGILLDASETATIIFDDPLPTPRATIKIITTDGISAQYTETFSGATGGSGTPGVTQYTITVTQTANGAISPGTSAYDEGSTPSFTITPTAGYYIASITANGGAVTITNPTGQTYQFPALAADGTITATYALITVTQISSSNSGFSEVQAGDLLVVMPNTRYGSWTGDALTCTAADYTTLEVAAYRDDDSDRRAVAMLIKVADGTESGAVSCSWSSSAYTYTTIYQVYRSNIGADTTWTYNGESGESSNGGGAESTSIPTISGLASSSTANVLSIGALVVRDNPNTVTMTNLGTQRSSVSNNCYTFTEFTYGSAVTSTSITWNTQQLATGLLLQIECT